MVKRSWWVALVVAVLLVLGGVGFWHGGWISTPPDDASPDQVVQAYARALHWRDCATAERLAPSTGRVWCGTDITPLVITSTAPEEEPQYMDLTPPVQRVMVQMQVSHGDASTPDGPHDWGFWLTRSGPHGAWRIVGQGMG